MMGRVSGVDGRMDGRMEEKKERTDISTNE